MPIFYVQATERYGHTVLVEAEDDAAARKRVEEALWTGELEITEDDYWDDSLEVESEVFDERWYGGTLTMEELKTHQAERKTRKAERESLESYRLTLEERFGTESKPSANVLNELVAELRERVELDWSRQADALVNEYRQALAN